MSNLKTAVVRAKTQSWQRKTTTCNGNAVHALGVVGFNRDSLFFLWVLCELCGEGLQGEP